jgi:hypothetical protein
LLVQQAHAVTISYAGEYLVDAFGNDVYEFGVTGTIAVDQTTPNSGDTVAYWINLGVPLTNAPNEGLQAGYCLGQCPDGLFHTSLQMYVEWQVNFPASGTYGFHIFGVSGWSTQHAFKVWLALNNANAAIGQFSIDGTLLPYAPQYSCDGCGFWASTASPGGLVDGSLEVHYTVTPDLASGAWSNLAFGTGSNCGFFGGSTLSWYSWGSCFTTYSPFQTSPYLLAPGTTAFSVSTLSGGGGSAKKN